MDKETINTSISLWATVGAILVYLASAVWIIIKLYFSDNAKTTKMLELEDKILDVELESSKALKEHKDATSKEINDIKSSLSSISTTLTEVKTYTKLLVENRIKKDGEK